VLHIDQMSWGDVLEANAALDIAIAEARKKVK
jgi:hypothetical protein